MLISMLPLSMLKSCRCYRFDVNIFEVDVPVFDVSYFLRFIGLSLEIGDEGVAIFSHSYFCLHSN